MAHGSIRKYVIIGLIISSHVAGLVGLLLPASRPLFLRLTPYHLLFMVLLILGSKKNLDGRFLVTSLVIIVSAFFLEYLGVKTGKIFGAYQYGRVLGSTLGEVPLMIGLNWFSLIMSSSAMVWLIDPKGLLPLYGRAGISAGLMVGMDFLMEPIAVLFNYWTWDDGVIPLQNYIAWFVFSFLLQLFYQKRGPEIKNIPMEVLYISQGIFFLFLNIGLRS